MKDTIMEVVMRRLAKKLGVKGFNPNDMRDAACLDFDSVGANWLADLQDCLEDVGISLRRFCAQRPDWFVVKRARLRLKHPMQELTMCHIANILMDIEWRRR